MEIKSKLEQNKGEIESFLQRCLGKTKMPAGLKEAIGYSLLAGGKRLRPTLCMEAFKLFDSNYHNIMPFACGIEMIHTYSLIHDDLPAMDDDDLRRGKPSNHRVFGEGNAILAGDGLLTLGCIFMNETSKAVPTDRVNTALSEVLRAAGPAGMVGGQYLDLQSEKKDNITLQDIEKIHSLKTGALMKASIVSGAILAGAEEKDLTVLRSYGKNLGLLFQITDDLLDLEGDPEITGKPMDSDNKMGKATYPAILGINKTRKIAEEIKYTSIKAISGWGVRSEFFQELVKLIWQRQQ